MAEELSHREQRCLFTRLMATLVLWIAELDGYEVADDEGTVHSPRWARRGTERLLVEDAVHKKGSFHHKGLARDLNLYHKGIYITDGDDPIWEKIAEKWESLHPLCTAGLRFGDANHLSLGEGTRAGVYRLP